MIYSLCAGTPAQMTGSEFTRNHSETTQKKAQKKTDYKIKNKINNK